MPGGHTSCNPYLYIKPVKQSAGKVSVTKRPKNGYKRHDKILLNAENKTTHVCACICFVQSMLCVAYVLFTPKKF
jgi:hypothetical protein